MKFFGNQVNPSNIMKSETVPNKPAHVSVFHLDADLSSKTQIYGS
jgi:hypothetical protein